MTPKVSIIIPYIRPKNLTKLARTIIKNAGVKRSDYEIIAEYDKNRIGAPKMVKKLVNESQYDLVMFLGDDTLPEKNFLKNAIKAMRAFTNMDGMVGLNDQNRNEGEAPTHWLASRKLLSYLDGEFFHTGYIHQYCDNELAARCMMANKYVYAKDAKIKHNHPGFKSNQDTFTNNVKTFGDEDYRRVYNSKAHDHDEKLFNSRMKKYNMIFSTGERVVIGDMKKDIVTLQEHITRYNFAMKYCINKKVLDVACGTGYGVNMLAEAATAADGWDVSANAIAFARSKFKHTYEVHDITKRLPNIKFDTITSFETIEHVKDPSNFLRWVVDHCDTFVFSVPLNNPSKYHAAVYSLEELEKLVSKYWTDVEWLNQEWIYINQGVHPTSTFAVGICTSNNKKRLTKRHK